MPCRWLGTVRSSRNRSGTLKTQTLKKSGLVTLYRGQEGFGQLGGLKALQVFCMRALMHRNEPHREAERGDAAWRTGCRQERVCQGALVIEACRPTLVLDIGCPLRLPGRCNGSQHSPGLADYRCDGTVPSALSTRSRKHWPGLGSSGDSGVSSRLFGTFLTWLSDHESDVFVVCTSNDISKLPPEFSRAERFDGIFFLDLPTREEKEAIWKLYRGLFDIAPSEPQPEDTDWTGAEIRSCCRLASLLDIPLSRAATNVVPVAVMAGEQVERLRKWASGRCLSASEPGIYRRAEPASTKPGRRVTRGNSNDN